MYLYTTPPDYNVSLKIRLLVKNLSVHIIGSRVTEKGHAGSYWLICLGALATQQERDQYVVKC